MPDDTLAQDFRKMRVDQVGSLAAPQKLRAAFNRFKNAEINREELAPFQDEAIREVIQGQEAIGFPIVTDGEFRRSNFQESFGAAVTGFHVAHEDKAMEGVTRDPFQRAEQNFDAPGAPIITRRRAVERLKLAKNIPLEEYRFSKTVATKPVRQTVLSADRISQRFDLQNSRSVYKNMDEFLADVVAISRRLIAELVQAGCRYISIDAPGYTAYVDSVSIERMRSRGEDPDEILRRSIAADNAMIAGFDDITFGIHLCRGNPRTVDPKTGKVVAQWHREGYYDAIAERVFQGLNHHRFLLEYDDQRSGSFEPLRYMPKGKVAVLGLVSTKTADIEPLDMLERRIDEASKFISVDQLAISPQCGFGGMSEVTLTQDEQWRKLERVLETAHTVWGRA
jgi:5-methyltetrahydropteroyltriglutamate--homocysteine methyltransferase